MKAILVALFIWAECLDCPGIGYFARWWYSWRWPRGTRTHSHDNGDGTETVGCTCARHDR